MEQVRERINVATLRAASILHAWSLGEGPAVGSEPMFSNGIRRLREPST